MGSTSAMESINRVLEKHSAELKQELHERYPSRLIRRFSLENHCCPVNTRYTSGN